MTEYCYPECTTSVITALAIFRKHYPDYRAVDIECAFSLLLYESLILTITLKTYAQRRNQVPAQRADARGWLGRVVGHLFHVCNAVRAGELVARRRDVRNEHLFAEGM